MEWHVLGAADALPGAPPNLTWHGWVANAPDRMARSEVVIVTAGNGAVGTVLATGRPLICIPQDRPFGEQRSTAAALVRAGGAVQCDNPATADWPALIERARALDPGAARALDDPSGPERAARWLVKLADRGGRS
nr:glycosyltransferase [Sphingomonas japonica]